MNAETIILVVEDNDDDFFATRYALEKIDLYSRIRRCATGDQAIDYLLRQGEYAAPESSPRPSLILLDLNLPGLDGREVLGKIKSDPVLKKIPVIVFSTSSALNDIEGCYLSGGNSYVQKPVELSDFVDSIAQLIGYWLELSLLPKRIA